MRSYYTKFIQSCFLFGTTAIVLSGCNGGTTGSASSGTTNPSSAYFKGATIPASTQSAPMDIQWSMDGMPLSTGYNIYDTAWHLLTLTVVDTPQPLTTPIAVKGLQYVFYPIPTDNRGEKIELTDINCETAQFSKNGDTCSAYIRVSYDTTTGTSNPPLMQVQVATNAYSDPNYNLSAVLYVNYKPMLDLAQGDYRVVSPIETKYYTGSTIAANPNQYQILSMQNLSMPPLTINKITNVSNPTFTLINREGSSSTDPYYGLYSQCSLTANTALDQVNYLPEIGSECILVYQAASTSDQAIESDSVSLETNAGTTAPWTTNNLKLMANYVTGATIPDQTTLGYNFLVSSGTATPSGTSMVMTSTGTLSSGTLSPSTDPFNLVNVGYDFKPKSFEQAYNNMPYYSNGVINIANQEIYSCGDFGMGCKYAPTVVAGQQVLTDASSTNPVTAGKVSQLIVPGTGSTSKTGVTVSACGGASASSYAYITMESYYEVSGIDQAHMGAVHLHMDNNSNGHCGTFVPSTYDTTMATDVTSSITVYDIDQQGCGGGTWDEGGKVSIKSNGCSGNNCSYTVTVSAHHGGTCTDTQTQTYNLNYVKPQIYMQLSQLSNFNQQGTSASIVGTPGQNLNAMLGTQGGAVAQTINCPNGQRSCTANGLYTNGLSATSMSYNIGLNAGDELKQGTVNFTPSNGYSLSDFTITH